MADEALGIFREMKESCKPDLLSYNALMSACSKCRRWRRAIWVQEEMEAAGVLPDLISYNALMSACRHEALKKTLKIL